MSLPIAFLEEMRGLLGSAFEDYLDSFKENRISGIRINTNRVSMAEHPAILPVGCEPISWIANGYYYPEHEKPAKSPYYYAGLYYLQEPSAMTPAALLPVSPGDKVLDLCAAPGGKSTELGAKLAGEGLLWANDLSSSRAKALLKNLELFGIPNICVTSETPEHLAEKLPAFFDKILVDAPCSGEGMFRKDEHMIKSWLEKGPDYYAPIQKSIMIEAVKMLKPGGLLLYSTCTFSRQEDEEVIEYLLTQRTDMELVPISLWQGASDGIGLSGCIRLFPHLIKGEGHFMALLKKKELPPEERDQIKRVDSVKEGTIRTNQQWQPPAEFTTFFNDFCYPLENGVLQLKNDQVYLLPPAFPHETRFRFLRTGLLLGTLHRQRFEPSQALAMVLNPAKCARYHSFSINDDRVIRYLKGETLQLKQSECLGKGWCLIGVEHYSLGFAKENGLNLKNKYYPGWRWL